MFNEIYKMKERLNNLANIFGDDPANVLSKKGIDVVLKIIDDIKKNEEQSTYFRYISPLDTGISPLSQIRAIAVDPIHVKNVEESIFRHGKVLDVVLVARVPNPGGDYKYELLNGVHRDTAANNLIKSARVGEDFVYPAIVISPSEHGLISPVIPLLQGGLNDYVPTKGNNTNDMQKIMEAYLNRCTELDLNDPDDYAFLLSVFYATFLHAKKRTIKSNLTRLKNKRSASRSDVYCASPEDYIDDFLKTFSGYGKRDSCAFTIDTKKYKNGKVSVVSVTGSSFDQLFPRTGLHKHNNPSSTILYLFACQDHKGDSQTTLTSRQAFFKRFWKLYRVFGSGAFKGFPDLIAIAPQNKASFEARINDEIITTQPEHARVASSWIFVTKKQLYKQFTQATNEFDSYKREWIVAAKI